MSRSIAFAGALVLASVAGLSHAQDRSSVRVDLTGYDLTNPADAQKVYRQVQRAARQVCENADHQVFGSDEAERVDICVRNTVDSVVAQSKSPMLAALNGQIAPSVRMAAVGGGR
jgi:UrcA family protein